MGVKDRLRRLQKAARGKLDHIELADGSRYWFDRQEVFWVTFRFFTASMRADWKREPRPDPPAVLRAVADARNREQALSRVMGGSSFLALDEEALVERGEVVHRPLAPGFPPVE